MAKRGPKGLNLDLKLIEQLASLHCTNTEIAAMMGCDASLLTKPNYSTIVAKGKERGKLTLRRKMFQTALGGNVTMMIWLSKQLLGMTDKQDNQHIIQLYEKVKGLSDEELSASIANDLKGLKHDKL